MSMFQSMRGNLYLGYRAIVAHPLRLLFSRDDRSGKQRFLDNYAREGLLPLTDEDREILRGASRCIHCGLCDFQESTLSAASHFVYDGPSLLPLAYSRALSDLPRARDALALMSEQALAKGESVCPTRVPLRAIAAWARQKLAELK